MNDPLILRNTIEKAMKSLEVTVSIFADYSKSFDTINFENNLLQLILAFLLFYMHHLEYHSDLYLDCFFNHCVLYVSCCV